MTSFAYIARSRLFVKLDDEPPRQVESPFANDVAARGSRIARKNAWKTGGTGARFMRGFGGTPDDALEASAPNAPVSFVGVARGRHAGELLYSLSSGQVSGVFAFSSGEETRLFHGADVHVESIACSEDGSRIVCSAHGGNGYEHLAIMAGDGSDLTFVTEGDCLDSTPVFAAGSARRIAYASRGYGFDASGMPVDFGTAVIECLDLDSGEITRLAALDKVDCTSPQLMAGGDLYYVERPRVPAFKPSVFHVFLDALLFPLRLIGAIFSYLNFFVMRWSGKSLMQSGSAQAKRADAKRLWQTQQVTSAIEGIEDDPALEKDAGRAATDHVLVRVRDGERAVLAKRVACFDIGQDGVIVYSDGRDLFTLDGEGKLTKRETDQRVTHVIAIPAQDA